MASLPPLYGIGGTSVGGYEPLPLVEAPYLKEGPKNGKVYTLVLDLDETLVHYFEVKLIDKLKQIGNEGHFLVRPGVDLFLKDMNDIYEVVIFTAAMQDVLFYRIIFDYSMQTGFLIKQIQTIISNIDYIDSMPFLQVLYL